MVGHYHKFIQFYKWIMFWNFRPIINGDLSDDRCSQNNIPGFLCKWLQNNIHVHHNHNPVIGWMVSGIYFEIYPLPNNLF